MITINERSTGRVTLTFMDDSNQLVVPATAQYAITDATSGTFVVALGNFSPAPTGATYDLIVTADQNAIIDGDQDAEERIISVVFTYSGKQATAEYHYLVKRLKVFAATGTSQDGYDDGGTWV